MASSFYDCQVIFGNLQPRIFFDDGKRLAVSASFFTYQSGTVTMYLCPALDMVEADGVEDIPRRHFAGVVPAPQGIAAVHAIEASMI